MRIAFAPAGRRDARTAVQLARRAEDLGFAEVWLSEDYLERGVFAVAGAVAAATERVTVGLGVINPWTRHVALTAMECGALDEVSGGRLVIGLGASNKVWMQDQLGIRYDRPISTLTAFSDDLRALLAGDAAGSARLSFTPVRPHPPVFWGVKGERALAAGAERADGLMLSVLSTPAYVRWIRAQHPRPDLTLTGYAAFSCADDPAEAYDRVRSRTARFLGMHGASPITGTAGLDPELAERLRARMLAGQDGADLVDDEVLATFTLAGDPERIAAGMTAFATAGLDTLVVMDDGVGDPMRVLDDAATCAGRAGLL